MTKSHTYRNIDAYHRTWSSLRGPDGSTLSLEPGEEVTLAEEVEAAYLEPVAGQPTARQKPAPTSQPTAPGPAPTEE